MGFSGGRLRPDAAGLSNREYRYASTVGQSPKQITNGHYLFALRSATPAILYLPYQD
jgi:hypothetical protein